MKLLLNENIRNNRKKMSLTQEQLAEAMGVSVATVSKWENGSVSPDIGMLAELAEFFQTSVDVLIGYQWEKKSADQCTEHIKRLCNERAYEEAIKEAKKAIQKYPNQFKVVYECADTLFASYLSLYRDEHGKHKPELHKEFAKVVALYERALDLFEQNTDKNISRESIHQNIGNVYAYAVGNEEAVEYLEEHNFCHINDKMLGMLLCDVGEFDRAWEYLFKTMKRNLFDLWNNHMGVWATLLFTGRYNEALETSKWMKQLCVSVADEESSYFLRAAAIIDAMMVTLYVYKEMEEKQDYQESIKVCMRSALEGAIRFDANPDYTGKLRFFGDELEQHLHDGFGNNAINSVKMVFQCFSGEAVFDRLVSIFNDAAKVLEIESF